MRRFHRPAIAPVLVCALVAGMTLGGCSGGGPDIDREPIRLTRPDCDAGVGADIRRQRSGQVVLVHLPACYDRTAARYPTIYLVHGSGADEQQWLDIGLTSEADRLVRTAETGPAIIVMPREGSASSDAEARNLVDDVVPWADATLRTLPDRGSRAVGGISRGGEAALEAAAQHPELFGAVGGHSPTLPEDREGLIVGLRPLAGRVWLDVGTDDGLRRQVAPFAEELDGSGTTTSLLIAQGDHDRSYWRGEVPHYLRFYAGGWR
jgi:enterochelin esterase-like enzyme